VFVSSIAGFQPFHMLGAYSVSKSALIGLTKVLSAELANDNIRVNCLAPGLIKTKFSSAVCWMDGWMDGRMDGWMWSISY
jgi:dehydrogenase/reductase SDR family protein 4